MRNSCEQASRTGGSVTAEDRAERARKRSVERRIIGGALRDPSAIARFLAFGVAGDWFADAKRRRLWTMLAAIPAELRDISATDEAVAGMLEALAALDGGAVSRALVTEARLCLRDHKRTKNGRLMSVTCGNLG